ncbi:putative bifunctional diguanylate cyclase/phosphodiesterase [Qipengyuania atrilutea]|uniref:EAL domain-containing protein n=1 Tax=Qipengyuania atrilutea TaxID=2744473 RepID=A0A850H4B3_9SPHN|nr:EAL domain-containing protein [Actirhodobacter atriluteus]NVD45032.1 EAL domain-containing protein [Actirhodobacter atriluteus]
MTGPLKNFDSLRFGSLKVRIGVLYALLFGAVLAAIMVIVSQGVARFGEESAARDLSANARVFDELLDVRAQQMRSSAEVLSRDFGFREAVATDDRATIASALASLRGRSELDTAFVVGLDGGLVGASGKPPPDTLRLWDALDAGENHGVIELGDDLALAAASPIEVPNLVGWLVLAQPLDGREMKRLKSLAAVELDADVIRRRDLPADLDAQALGHVFERESDTRMLHRISALPVLEEGLHPRLVLRHSLTASLEQYSSLNWLIGGLGVFALLLVLSLSFRVARTITKPLQKLDEAARRVSDGRDAHVAVETDDEIGRLARSFNTMVDAIEERERKITHVGLHDGLTNLPNRKLFVEQLSQAVNRRGGDERLMVVYVDLDDFKVVNDTLGHPAGDALLRDVADHLRLNLPEALIARLGGDEFAILVDDIAAGQNLADLAARIQACFIRTITLEGQQADCSASLGIAIAPGDGADSNTLMKNADLALYRAKRDGKANYHFFEPSLDEQARRRRQMELDLRTAIRDGQFTLHFQPLYSLSEERLKGFEALIRWEHPEHGLVSPVEFIPLAEETGLILPIGEWVVREACRHAATWDGDLSVAVNVSPKQFGSPELATKILQAISTSGIAPQRLELEITESIFIANVEKTLSTLHRLRNLGVKIALDDFGTGYSSLSYLRSFPFDKVKIDRSFVQDLANGGNGHAVIRAITTLAEALGMDTLAEGVEDPGQLDILRREGCRNIQGYLFSKPLQASNVQQWIVEHQGSPRNWKAA